MDRMRGYSNLGARGAALDDAARERQLRAVAARLKPKGRVKLRLDSRCAAALRGALREVAALEDTGDEALRRLKADAGHIETCLRQARTDSGASTVASEGGARVLRLARMLVSGGEQRLTKERLLRDIAAFDAARPLEMREIQLIPEALRIALCEALNGAAADVLYVAHARAMADRWVRGNGKGRVRSRCDEAFFERALQLSAELERPELHARVERAIERCGQRREWLVERAHRIAADNCLRLDNLMRLNHLLDSLNWRKCFDALSPAELELRDDPAKVYPNMDGDSRARVRRAVEELARLAGMEEIVVVRCALRAARRSMDEYTAEDPRASVCWYLAEDAGRAALCAEMGVNRRPRRVIPDARGGRTAALVLGLTAVLLAICLWAMDNPILMIYGLPLAWVTAWRLIGRFYPRFVKPGKLLKLKIKSVPDDARTLVALPVLLSSEQRAKEMVARMEALGCLERDANIDYLLLGDFRDGDMPGEPEDESILRAAREGVARLNRAAGREKYFYLHRARMLRERDGRWMGENRKRGALMALNRLLLNRAGAAEAFGAESGCAEKLAGRYAYVVTLDQDTEYLPGTIQKLIGAMLHPLNRARTLDGAGRGYAVLQPDMQLTADAVENAYVELTSGLGGVDGYPVSVSDFYQDMTGRGSFAGKGIYDVRAFAEATEGVLPDDDILSHDLIEGILSGAGIVNDVRFYDGCPSELSAELVRLHRWTRGDWQLLPVLFSKIKFGAADRLKIIGNLLRSLYAPALLGLFIHAVWLDAPGAFAVGLALSFLEPVLSLSRGGGQPWKRALLQLATLPATAVCQLDAILRTLWRLAVSHKHLMEWVPAADASGSARRTRVPGHAAALLVLPGLLRAQWIVPVLGIAMLFWVGAGWADDLSRQKTGARRELRAGQAALIAELARRTWQFFETYVPEDGPGLPPDNVQIDPELGPAMRTSPTNIGLYLMSCLAARELGFIADADMCARMAATVDTLEALEKWNGQLYNWYDIAELAPLRPRYVSAVDSGNLAGALLLCAHAAAELDPALSGRLRKLAEDMDLAALYDAERELFCIGMDVESGHLSESHYDLYASEARILSFAAMMLGQVSARHWSRLNRAAVRVGNHSALVSWSGTMFEYLMPELLLRSCANTLAGQSRRGVAACQIRRGKLLNRPWGVSESGFYAFDMHLNYQYHAFGLRALALSGDAEEDVVAPYAAALALCCDPAAAAENLRWMCALGWSGEYGLYEAADYAHTDAQRNPRLVRSYMAHHQGMALCAMCNALRDDALAKAFMRIPEARALRLLLQEKPGSKLRLCRRVKPAPARSAVPRPDVDYFRGGKTKNCAADVQLLRGAETTALVTARGAVFAWSEGLQLNRFSGDLMNTHEGMYVHLEDVVSGECTVFGGRAGFDAGTARFRKEFAGLNAELRLAVSPEDGALYQSIEIENPDDEPRELIAIGCLAVALAPERDMRAHPVFQNIFVESEKLNNRALALRRRSRKPGEETKELIYLVSGGDEPRCETSLEALIDRTGSLGEAGGLDREFEENLGCVLNPCAALRVRVTIPPKRSARLHFALLLAAREEREARAARAAAEDAADRAIRLATAQARTTLTHAGVDASRCRLYQRSAALLFDAKLRTAVAEGAEACAGVDRRALWSIGISGDLPILLIEVGDGGNLDCAREGVRMHAFYRSMGVWTDFVLVDSRGGDYRQNGGGELGGLIAASHLNGLMDVSGGAHILERFGLSDAAYAALTRFAALRLGPDGDPLMQLRGALDVLALRHGEAYRPMKAAEMQMPDNLKGFNGYGGYSDEGYFILLRSGQIPPAPWSNIVASERAGAMLTERGGGFAWFGNSRSGRLTPFANDSLREGWGWMFYLVDAEERDYLRLLPGDAPMTDFVVRYAPGLCSYAGRTEALSFETRVSAVSDGVCFVIELRNESDSIIDMELAGFVNWLMGTDALDAGAVRTWPRFGACFASGAMAGVGVFVADDAYAAPGCDRLTLLSGGDVMNPRGLDLLSEANGGWTLRAPVRLRPGEARGWRFLLACAEDVAQAYALVRAFRAGNALRGGTDWENLLGALKIETPDAGINFLANGFLLSQALDSRVRGRTGLYQPGGAYGFRDQMQDMMALIHFDPARVRRHLLYCAARQFEDGDVLHWWHDPYTGVRTRISDDLLFLPWAAARYVETTGDASILSDSVPYLEDVAIPKGEEDIYAEMRPSPCCGTLHEHCMRALRRAAETGEHGLCRMGGGDWNDGMNRVGAQGRGESVWLSEFLAVVASDYARVAPNEEDCAWLTALNERLCAAVEAHGWDGEWYLRAYADDGRRLGSHEGEVCQIDAISQAWAVFAGLDARRCESAMDAVWSRLADERLNLIRLLDPPFDGGDFDPGYIAAYPPGIRENGAQYTHAACWVLGALIRQGDAARAHRALRMLLPLNHAADRRSVDVYRVEPYVMAADIYTNGACAGRGGWTWYTGSASWMLQAIWALLGFERRGAKVRLRALLGEWPEVSAIVRFGSASYRLICRRDAQSVTLDGAAIDGEFIEMTSDGREHIAVFPPREPAAKRGADAPKRRESVKI